MRHKARAAAIGGAGVGAAALGWKLWSQANIRRKNRRLARGRKIVILGAGFAGLNAAQELARLLPGRQDCEITLVDQNNFLLFTPMLSEVAGGELDPRHIVAPPRRLSHRIDFAQGKVLEIDLAKRSVSLEVDPSTGAQRNLDADHLVIALGSSPNFHGVPGAEEHALTVKSVGDAIAIRNRVLASLERASWEPDAGTRREILTFVVGGGGFTGVETAAAVNDLARESAKYYPVLSTDDIAAYLLTPEERLLPELDVDLASFAQKKLEQRGVTVLLKTKIARAGRDFVEAESGRRLEARTLIWAGGVRPNPAVEKLDCQRGRHGGITVDRTCAVPGHPGVWAIGDCAEIPQPDGKGTYAPTAQNGTREGELVARNIAAVLRGEEPKPFDFEAVGEMALVGRHAGVGEIYGVQFSGIVAWALWRAVYLSKMPGAAQRSRIALDWILDFIFGRNIAEIPVDHSVIT